MLSNVSRVPLSQKLPMASSFTRIPNLCQKAEKRLHLDFEGRRSVHSGYQIYLTHMTE
jgi:hypothetical protein